MNIAALIGNVASDPDLRHTSMGRAICSFRLAVTRPTDDEADFFQVITRDRQADICNTHLRIGRRVSIEGRMSGRIEPPSSDNAAPRSRVEIVAHRVELVGSMPTRCDTRPQDATAQVEVAR